MVLNQLYHDRVFSFPPFQVYNYPCMGLINKHGHKHEHKFKPTIASHRLHSGLQKTPVYEWQQARQTTGAAEYG